jgi:small nuclear ribonucleoprotein (snRNP)-like protein
MSNRMKNEAEHAHPGASTKIRETFDPDSSMVRETNSCSDGSSREGSVFDSGDEKEDDEQEMGMQRLGGSGPSTAEPSMSVRAKRKPKLNPIQRTLAIVLVSLQGFEVAVEMKNGIEVTGILEECDKNMNLTLHNVRQVNMQGGVKEMEIAFVSGSSILYVHMSPQLDVRSNLSRYVINIVYTTLSYYRSC